MAGRLAWCVCLFCVFLAVASQCSGAEAAAFPTFGVAFTPPDNAVSEAPTWTAQVAVYKFAKASPYSGAALIVEAARANGKGLEELAGVMAVSSRALRLPGELTVGNEKAVKLAGPFAVDAFTHRTICVAVHDNRLYLFSMLMPAEMDATKPLADFLQTVKFTAAESPLEHITDLADRRFNILGLFTIAGPRSMRQSTGESSVENLSIVDMSAAAGNDLELSMQASPLPPKLTIADIRNACAAAARDGLRAPPLEWSSPKDLPDLSISQTIRAEIPAPDGSARLVFMRFGVFNVGGGTIVRMNFNILAKSKADAQVYIDASDRMIASINVLSKMGPPKP